MLFSEFYKIPPSDEDDMIGRDFVGTDILAKFAVIFGVLIGNVLPVGGENLIRVFVVA